MKKYSSLIIAFLIGILFILFYKLGISGVIYNEASYKMNGVEPRFVKTFIYTPINKVESLNNSTIDSEKQVYFNKLQNLIPKIEKLFISLNMNENIYFFIEDLANAGVTAKIIDGKISLSNNITESIVPTMTFRINKEDIDGIDYFLSDDTLNKEEQLKIADVLIVGIVENLYRQEKFYKASDMSMFKFDNFMHFEIKDAKNILRAGKLVNLNVSILNVDGQWIIKKGLIGDPDIKVSISLEEALKFYKIVSVDLKKSNTKKDALTISKKAFDILIPNITYVRKDHK